jgi:hypothetical protein
MKTLQLALSERIYDRVVSILELLPESECRIVEAGVTSKPLEICSKTAPSAPTLTRDEIYADRLR